MRGDHRLVGTGQMDKAAIFDAQGTSVWATSPGFSVAPQELKDVVTAFNDKGDANGVKQVQSTGIHIGGERYVVLKADERSLYGKKGKEGIVIVKTTQALLVAHHPETIQTPNAANIVETLADYLIKVGY
ncbi:MAG: profilin, required for normal timing of actin polymerization in response to thermal stress [Alyxoria varia]|nr:MAG: profilin, required for normal timing of actin polymerization in response to thermal stress [Alyxoria varia]